MKWFENIRVRKPKLNKFDLSHERKGTGNFGWLYPIFVKECLPGDKWRVTSQVFLRFLALIAPVLHRCDVTVHYFKVPLRLLWDGFEDFITGGRDGLAVVVPPKFRPYDVYGQGAAFLQSGSLLDHLGFPCLKGVTAPSANYNTSQFEFNALPLRAYQLIYDTYYRDQNVEASVLTANFKANGLITGADLAAVVAKRSRTFEKDYLTGVLPFLQRGNAVSVPITGSVTYRKPSLVRRASDDALQNSGTISTLTASGELQSTGGSNPGTSFMDNVTGITSSMTINALRSSMRLQEWLEANARGGARYIEQIAMHFGVVSSDARLQRPQYLGGGKQPVVISEILQTAPAAGGSTPLAQLAGHGISVGSTNRFSTYCEEHGLLMGLLSIVVRTAYVESLDRMWLRLINTDYYFPEFAHLGEQSVINGEVYSDWSNAGASAAWATVFGYNGRYAEYKHAQSTVHGQFRETGFATWHFSRSFSGYPALNSSFMAASNTPYTPFAVQTDVDHIVWQIYNKVDVLRPMPYFSTPST